MAINDRLYFSSRGCYYLIDGVGSPSFYSVSPGISSACPVLYNDVVIRGMDHVAKNICFNGIRNAAVVSKAFGEVSVGGLALLGSVESTASFASAFMSAMNSGRVYNKVAPCSVSSAHGGAHKFLLETYELGIIDDEFNIQRFRFGGALLD